MRRLIKLLNAEIDHLNSYKQTWCQTCKQHIARECKCHQNTATTAGVIKQASELYLTKGLRQEATQVDTATTLWKWAVPLIFKCLEVQRFKIDCLCWGHEKQYTEEDIQHRPMLPSMWQEASKLEPYILFDTLIKLPGISTSKIHVQKANLESIECVGLSVKAVTVGRVDVHRQWVVRQQFICVMKYRTARKRNPTDLSELILKTEIKKPTTQKIPSCCLYKGDVESSRRVCTHFKYHSRGKWKLVMVAP